MEFSHVFTTGISNLEWTKRDVKIQDSKGNNVFEQEGVEAPRSWSDNAVNIVANKYFKKHNGVYETSVKQLLGRVINTIKGWGEKFGYFTSAIDANIFCDELYFLLANQYACFNSPVWFNFGVEGRPQQAHACFLLGLEDNTESICKWMSVESNIFKGGSGSGINLSPLRHQGALLSAGGTASGPMSFAKAADCNAGVWKSGGVTRRAATLRRMDVTHPDIKDFILCKATEEKKAQALIGAGYDGGIDGEAYRTVAYQNMNHSVGVSDEFMKRVLAGDSETQEIMDLMAVCAWESGDPGIQYDDTINAWHTIPKSGRITTSNPSMPAGVLVHTNSGIFPIETLEGKRFKVRQLDGSWQEAECFLSGKNKGIYKITFRSGVELFATAEHKWPVLHNTSYKGQIANSKIIKLNTLELSPYDRIPLNLNLPLELSTSFEGQEEEGFLLGYLTGDGWFSTRTKGEKAGTKVLGFVFHQEDRYIAERIAASCNQFSGYSNNEIGITTKDGCWYIQPSNKRFVSFIESFGIESGRKRLPPAIWQSNDNFIKGFVDGLFSADGSIDILAKSIRLTTSREELADDLIKLLSFYGIRCSKWGGQPRKHGKWPNGKVYDRTYVAWNVAINSSQINKFAKIFSLSNLNKQKALESLVDITKDIESTDEDFQIVESIESVGTADVWDISVFGGQHVFPVQYCYTGNCGEFLNTDWSACLLASFNLMKYRTETGFDFDRFTSAVHIFTVALDIIIDGCDYPDERFQVTSHRQRQMGLGYSNLGALLMSLGHPYASEEGRDLAAEITSVMTAESYIQSTAIAQELGAFQDYDKNKDAMLNVIDLHGRTAVRRWGDKHHCTTRWNRAHQLGKERGYRNSVTTLIAPTGTISFMMDCDTTGIESEIALLKYKKLVGGGTMTLVNSTVPMALGALGYSDSVIDSIVKHIAEFGGIEDCNYVSESHWPIFDCALKPSNGSRFIDYNDHLRMVAAVQPFLSMGISKTINMPNSASIEDVKRVLIDGWKMGIKSVALYRDGSKQSQPLNVGKQEEVKLSPRLPLPPERPSITHKFEVSGFEGYLHVGLYDNGMPGEMFIDASKCGSTISGLLDAFATSISYSLQFGVPLSLLVEKFTNTRFEPAGFTKNPEIRLTTSLVDYIFKWLKLKFLDAKPAVITRMEPLTPLVLSQYKLMAQYNGNGAEAITTTGEICSACGGMLQRTGTCLSCKECGNAGGCG